MESGIFTTKITSVDDFLGISDKQESKNGGIRIFPNPASSFVNIEVPQYSKTGFTIRILNLTGVEIGSYKSVSSKFTADLSSLSCRCVQHLYTSRYEKRKPGINYCQVIIKNFFLTVPVWLFSGRLFGENQFSELSVGNRQNKEEDPKNNQHDIQGIL